MALQRKYLKEHFGIPQNDLFSFQYLLMSASLSLCPGLEPAPCQQCHSLVPLNKLLPRSQSREGAFFLPLGRKSDLFQVEVVF